MTGQDSEIQWYIARDGKQHGPLTDVEMRTFVAHNYLRASDLIWRPGMAEWQTAPAAFPEALPTAAQQSAQTTQAARASPGAAAQASPGYNGNAAPAVRSPHSSDYDAGRAAQPMRNRARTLALAAGAITVIGGGAFALATYHQPLMVMVSGSSDAATEDGQPPVVSAPEDTKAAEAVQPSTPPASDSGATSTAARWRGTMRRSTQGVCARTPACVTCASWRDSDRRLTD